jgi:hypothetical protein
MFSGLKFPIRSLIKTPEFALSITPIVALGVEFNTASFSPIQQVLPRPFS